MDEVWKLIPLEGFRYDISNLGRLRHRDTYKILKSQLRSDGYYQIRLTSTRGKRKSFYIHCLLAAAFLGLDLNRNYLKIQVNHKDGNKSHNRLGNIEVVTHSQNHKHAFVLGLRSNKGEKNPDAKLTEIEVKEIRHLWNLGIRNKTLARQFNVCCSTISQVTGRVHWSHIT